MSLPTIEFHIIQSFPVCCLNRDDVGSPKSAVVGGVLRSRISSQCWKRAVRLQLHEMGCKLGLRTKSLAKVLMQACSGMCEDEKKLSEACTKLADNLIAKDALIFITEKEIEDLAKLLQESDFSEKVDIKDFIKAHKKGNFSNALDIALYGRMVAKQGDLTVEAACCFAHAVTTHKAATELDFYTAVADCDSTEDGDPGAAYLGTSEFTSGTFYRYVALDLNTLAENFMIDPEAVSDEEHELLANAVASFVKALFIAVPTARQHTMAAACPLNYAKVLVRTGQPLQLSFDQPVRSKDGFVKPSIERVRTAIAAQEKLFGEELYGKKLEVEIGEGCDCSLSDLISQIGRSF